MATPNGKKLANNSSKIQHEWSKRLEFSVNNFSTISEEEKDMPLSDDDHESLGFDSNLDNINTPRTLHDGE
jgi:hypothetical protein